MTHKDTPPEGRFNKLIDEQLDLAAVKLSSAFHLGRAAQAASKDLDAAKNFVRMTDTSTDPMLAKLEEAIPTRPDFGPFRGRRE
ncbi:hypothetical protein [Roseateles koreensis]|uniref:Phasin protein n=1 Tax=Roseateles koreensis TaxID=2987526 RepID=A0ABT5KZF9_9BURK|nr:hypothetical protein [Roseateles koreensis]MDC8787117.1 hypothetical protein [Roseateles koreensis]